MALALVGAVIAATAQKITEWKELLTVVDEHQRTVYYNRESGKPLKGEYRSDLNLFHSLKIVSKC